MIDKKIFGERLTAARKRMGYTHQYLADVLGVSRSMISKYENGVTLPQMDHAALLAKTLNVSLDYLMGLKDEE